MGSRCDILAGMPQSSIPSASVSEGERIGERRRVLLLTYRAAAAREYSDNMNALIQGGHSLSLAFIHDDDGAPPECLARYRLDPSQVKNASRATRLRRFLRLKALHRRVAGRDRRQLIEQITVAKYDPKFKRLMRQADLVFALDEQADYWERWADYFAPGTPFFSASAATKVMTEQLWRDRCATMMSAALLGDPSELTAVGALADHLQSRDSGPLRLPGSLPSRMVQDLAAQLARSRGSAPAYAVLLELAEIDRGMPPGEVDPIVKAALTYLELALHGVSSSSVQSVCAAAMSAAEEALRDKDSDRAARFARLTLALLLHRELHSDGLRSEMVADPVRYLQPWCRSGVFRVIEARGRGGASAHPAARRTGRVVVLPGVYPLRDQAWVVAARAIPGAEVDVLNMRKHASVFRGMELDDRAIADLLEPDRSPQWQQIEPALAVLAQAEVVIADWSDPGAVWASCNAPEAAQLIVRFHGVDVLSGWIHLLDWSRVDDIVFPAPHMQDLVVQILGHRIEHARLHVIPNYIDRSKFKRPKRHEAQRTLALVGWAQRVKDPVWALEVLEELLKHDRSWRLLLVGRQFASFPSASGLRYQREFARRLADRGLKDHVEIRGFTSSLHELYEEVGFVLSCSRREGYGIAFAEGVASGAVPILRDWPIFASLDAAARTFTPDWVVVTPVQAADRIRESSTLENWQRAARTAQAQLLDLAPSDDTLQRMRSVIKLRGSAQDTLGE